MRSLKLARLLVALVAVFACVDFAWSQVRVRGYTRKDGTYVAPHYRSSPDGNFGNNWSTAGNVNPYTGKVGTKTTSPANYGADVSVSGYYRTDGTYVAPHTRSAPDGELSNNYGSTSKSSTGKYGSAATQTRNYRPTSYAEIDANNRKGLAEQIRALGHEVDWQQHSYTDLHLMKGRIHYAAEAKALGHDVDWQLHSYSDLALMPGRIRYAAEAKALGYDVDWKKHSYSDLSLMPARIRYAAQVKALGYDVDWQLHSYSDLSLMPPRIKMAKELGLDWKKYSYSDLASKKYAVRY